MCTIIDHEFPVPVENRIRSAVGAVRQLTKRKGIGAAMGQTRGVCEGVHRARTFTGP